MFRKGVELSYSLRVSESRIRRILREELRPLEERLDRLEEEVGMVWGVLARHETILRGGPPSGRSSDPACPICGEWFDREEDLARHMREVHGVRSYARVCRV